MRILTVLLAFALPTSALGECPTWKPDIRFDLQGANDMSTLAWLGGWSSAIGAITRAGDLHYDVPDCGYLISKEIVVILNEKFEGKTVSAEIASTVIWPQLKSRFIASPIASDH